MFVHSFAVVLCFVASVLHVDGSVHLTVSPTDVSPTLTRSLAVNCTFTNEDPVNISNLVALIISRADQEEDDYFLEILALNVFTPNQADKLVPVDASVSGYINASDESFLSIHWTYPSGSESGLYRCDANVMDKVGRPMELYSEVIEVTTTDPGLDQVINTLSEVLRAQDDLELQVQNTQVIRALQRDLQQQAYLITILRAELYRRDKQQADLLAVMFEKSAAYKGRYYLLSKQQLHSAEVSEVTCEHWRGYLAEIDDAVEHEFIKNFLNNFTFIGSVFVGGMSPTGSGSSWIQRFSGRSLIYTYWYSGHPQHRGSASCMCLSESYDWRMFSAECYSTSSRYYYLCEVPIP